MKNNKDVSSQKEYRSMVKRNLPAILFGILLLLLSPLVVGIIFLSGDSCCGEDTSGTMRIVTYVLLTIIFGLAFLLNGLFFLYKRTKQEPYPLLKASFVSWLPSGVIYLLFVEVLIQSAFG